MKTSLLSFRKSIYDYGRWIPEALIWPTYKFGKPTGQTFIKLFREVRASIRKGNCVEQGVAKPK
jgi:hypothetical protein